MFNLLDMSVKNMYIEHFLENIFSGWSEGPYFAIFMKPIYLKEANMRILITLKLSVSTINRVIIKPTPNSFVILMPN